MTESAAAADTAHCAAWALCWLCSWVPCASPSRDLVSPPGTWSWLALTEITIVVDFMNRVSEVLKARRVSRGYLGWTAWMPHAHWYGVPSLSGMLICFLALGAMFWSPQTAACPRNTWQLLPYLSPYSLPLIAAVRTRPFPSLWFPAAVSSTLWHREKIQSWNVVLFTTALLLPLPSLWQFPVNQYTQTQLYVGLASSQGAAVLVSFINSVFNCFYVLRTAWHNSIWPQSPHTWRWLKIIVIPLVSPCETY